MPGTVDERPNWRLPLPKPLELLEHDPLVRRVAAAMEAGAERAAARQADHAGARPAGAGDDGTDR